MASRGRTNSCYSSFPLAESTRIELNLDSASLPVFDTSSNSGERVESTNLTEPVLEEAKSPVSSLGSVINRYAKTTNPFVRVVHSFRRTKKTDLEGNGELNGELSGFSLQMIAIGGSIGTGLLVGTGNLLSLAGILPVLISYMIVSLVVFVTCQGLGEMAVVLPVSGSFIKYTVDFVDKSWGYTMGWNYCLQWMTLVPLELVASTLVLEFWTFIQIEKWILITIFFVIITGLSLCSVVYYGIFEAVFSLIKVITILGFVIIGSLLDMGALGNERVGFKYLRDPGIISKSFKWQEVFQVLTTAIFSFAGTELVGLAAAESKNPGKQLPKAIKQVFWRISFFYLASLCVIGLLVPYDHENLINQDSNKISASPFVLALMNSTRNMIVLSHFFNGVILISILSVGHNAVYASSRALISLSENDLAPKSFNYVDKKRRPIIATLISLSFGFLAYLSILLPNGSKMMFEWLISLNGLSVLFIYGTICIDHIRFRHLLKIKDISTTSELPFRAPLGELGSYLGLLICVIIIVGRTCLTFNTPNLTPFQVFQNNVNLLSVVLCYATHKCFHFYHHRKLQFLTDLNSFKFKNGIFTDAKSRQQNKNDIVENRLEYQQLSLQLKVLAWIF